MNFLNITSPENSDMKPKERFQKGVWLCVPVVLTGAVLVSISYIIDILYAGGAELGIGETSAAAKTLYGIGSVINKLISPLLAGGIALSIGGLSALSGGLIGGILTGLGVTLSFSSGNTSAITGIFGSILAGIVAGYAVKLTNIVFRKTKGDMSNLSNLLSPVVSILLTAVAVFITDAVAQIINSFASIGLAGTGEFNKILLALMLAIMVTADIGGPLYLASLVYGVASIATGEADIMAAVAAAGMVPALSIGLSAVVFRDRFTKAERPVAYVTMSCGLCGISQGAIPFYTTRLHRIILPSVLGGCVASLLSVLFGCSALAPAGGLLSVVGTGSELYFLLATMCGGLVSTAIMGWTLKPVDKVESMQDNKENVLIQGATA